MKKHNHDFKFIGNRLPGMNIKIAGKGWYKCAGCGTVTNNPKANNSSEVS